MFQSERDLATQVRGHVDDKGQEETIRCALMVLKCVVSSGL